MPLGFFKKQSVHVADEVKAGVGKALNILYPKWAETPLFIRSFLSFFLLTSMVAAGLLYFIYRSDVRTDQAFFFSQEQTKALQQKKEVVERLRFALSDILVLSSRPEFSRALTSRQPSQLADIQREFKSFASFKNDYFSWRLIGLDGWEVVRVENHRGDIRVIPRDELENKADRYYFKQAVRQKKGEVFLSPMDLNLVHGHVMLPPLANYRLVTGVFDAGGVLRGLLVLNYRGADLIYNQDLSPEGLDNYQPEESQFAIWITEADEHEGWGYSPVEGFAAKYPEAWQTITSGWKGQFVNQEGLFTFETVNPLISVPVPLFFKHTDSTQVQEIDHAWKIICHVAPEALDSLTDEQKIEHLELFFGVMVLLALGGWLWAGLRREQTQAQKQLQDHERFVSALLDSSDDGIIAFDRQGNILAFNGAASARFGISGKEALQKPVYSLIPKSENTDLMVFFGLAPKKSSSKEAPPEVYRGPCVGIHAGGQPLSLEIKARKVDLKGQTIFKITVLAAQNE
ncbi:MAG: PAS domain S-box protein [Deltaproteobacteria bacterium]|nr:PAS domain S-box protein [Deltaproteobacteria bacterium]